MWLCSLPSSSIRATSHTSQGSWPCKYEGPWLSSKGHIMTYGESHFYRNWYVCLNLCQAHLLEVDLMQIPVCHNILFIICHCKNPWALRLPPSSVKWTLNVMDLFNQWEILECNGHKPSISCVKTICHNKRVFCHYIKIEYKEVREGSSQ